MLPAGYLGLANHLHIVLRGNRSVHILSVQYNHKFRMFHSCSHHRVHSPIDFRMFEELGLLGDGVFSSYRTVC